MSIYKTKTVSKQYDEGLRTYMQKVYNYMAAAVALTGVVAMLLASSPEAMNAIFNSGLKFVVMLLPLGLVFFISARINKIQTSTAKLLFWLFAASMGASLSSIFIIYTGVSIAKTFFIASASFGALSLYGYTTKKDLTGIGSFLIMGVFGLIIASLVNIFLQSSGLDFAISVIGVLVFAGLTAYDTQRIKNDYFVYGESQLAKASIMAALSLYMDFINLFIYLLRFFGERR